MNSLVFGILFFHFVGEVVNGVCIQFFRGSNFRDLNYESNSTEKCSNVPANMTNVRINSIKTDTCLMVYLSHNCEDYSIKFDLNNTLGWEWAVRSFHICNEDIGRHHLKIDIAKYYQFTESGVLESYRDVCTCINLPQYVQNMKLWSINNYGNDFRAYYQPDCSENKWKAESVPAGLSCSPGSGCMHLYEKTDSDSKTKHKILSIGPNPNSTYFKSSCSQFSINSLHSAKIDQLEKRIQTLLTEIQAMKEKTVELDTKQKDHYKSWEASLKKLKNDFEIFA